MLNVFARMDITMILQVRSANHANNIVKVVNL